MSESSIIICEGIEERQREVAKTARLHETTVKRAELHAQEWRPSRSRRPRRPAASTVRTLRVDRAVMKTALRLAGGDASRLKIVNERTVLVR